MTVALFGKRIFASAARSIGVLERKIENAGKSAFLILMYHRVVDHSVARRLGQEGMYVGKETFDRHLQFLKRRFQVVSLEEGLEFLARRRNRNGTEERPLCAITFDDGWKDIRENVYPLLTQHEIPATVFLPTGYIGTGRKFWTDRLASLLNKGVSKTAGESPLSLQGIDFRMPKLPESAAAPGFHKIVSAMKLLREDDIEKILNALEKRCGATDSTREERVFLDWGEVREMHASGLVQFGSHTENHKILTTLSEEGIVQELRISKERLVGAGVVKPESVLFAYPNGNHSERIAEIVREEGYRLAVTTEKGWNRVGAGFNPFRLKRIGVHEDIASTDAMFCCRITEIF